MGVDGGVALLLLLTIMAQIETQRKTREQASRFLRVCRRG